MIQRTNQTKYESFYQKSSFSHQDNHQIKDIQENQEILLKVYQKYSIQKWFQKIFLYSLRFYTQDNDKLHVIRKQINSIKAKTSIYYEIDQKLKEINQLKNQIIIFSDSINEPKQSDANKMCIHIKKYRQSMLNCVESILKMCKQFSNGQQKSYDKILLKCGRLFISLQQQSFKKSSINKFVSFEEGFDPLLLSLKQKLQFKNEIQKCCSFNITTSHKLIQAHKEMLKSIKDFQIHQGRIKDKQFLSSKSQIEKKSQQQKSETSPILQKNKLSTRQNIFSINLKDNKFFQKKAQKYDQIKSKVVENYRKKSFRQRLSLSLQKNRKQIDICDRTTISTDKYERQSKHKNKIDQKPANSCRKLNFRAVDLAPLDSKQSILALQKSQLSNSKNKFTPSQINTFRMKRKHYKKRAILQIKTQKSSQSDIQSLHFSDYNENANKTIAHSYFPSKKLSDNILRRYSKFQTEDQLSQRLSDLSPRFNLPASEIKEIIDKMPRHTQKNKSLINVSQIRIIQYSAQKTKVLKSQVKQQIQLSKEQQSDRNISIKNKHFLIQNQIQKLNENIPMIDVEKFDKPSNQLSELGDQSHLLQNPIMTDNSFPNQINLSSSIIQQKQNHKADVPQNIQTSSNTNLQLPSSKKIILKATKLSFDSLQEYFTRQGIQITKPMSKQIQKHQHYICEFYLNEYIFNVIAFCPHFITNCIEITFIHQRKHVENVIIDEKIKERMRKTVLNKFVEFIEKSTSNFQLIKYQLIETETVWMKQCNFIEKGLILQRKLKKIQNNKIKQFLSINGSVLKIQQQQKQTFLYSDQISTFKYGKYDVEQQIFKISQNTNQQSTNQPEIQKVFQNQFSISINTLSQANHILSQKNFDTYESNVQIESIINKATNNSSLQKNLLKTFSIQNSIIQNFVISNNGWIKTQCDLIYNQKNQRICSLKLNNKYQMYLGKGFQHIGTMKNKITHFKTRTNQTKSISSKSKQLIPRRLTTNIRMFSKQLYGLIKHQNNVAFYGNWQMNFHFKHEFIGKVNYNFQTTPGQNRVIFGNQSFFITIYQENRFLIGWEVQQDDFLY